MLSFKQFLTEYDIEGYADNGGEALTKDDMNFILKELKIPERYVKILDYRFDFLGTANVSVDFNTNFFDTATIWVGSYTKPTEKVRNNNGIGANLDNPFRMRKIDDKYDVNCGKDRSYNANKDFNISFYLSQSDTFIKDLEIANESFNELCKLISRDKENAEIIVSGYKKLKGKQFIITYNNGLLKIVVTHRKIIYPRDVYESPCLIYDVRTGDKKICANTAEPTTYDYRNFGSMLNDFKMINKVIKASAL